ncbi:MAG: hypothetical protein ACP5EN_13165 [Rhodovulum sp.]
MKKEQKAKEPRKSCFFVTPIGSDGSDARQRADAVLKHVLRPSLESDYDIVRADEVDDPGTITEDIIVRLYKSDLVIADLTSQNANVMYEVGIRHSFSSPIVQIAQDGEKLAFDLAGERTIFFDIKNLDSVEDAKKKISDAARRAVDAKPFRSPVVKAIQMDSLFSQAPATPVTETLVQKLEELETKLDDVSSDLGALGFQVESSNAYFGGGLNPHDERKLEEVLRFFDLVSPTDIARLASALKAK